MKEIGLENQVIEARIKHQGPHPDVCVQNSNKIVLDPVQVFARPVVPHCIEVCQMIQPGGLGVCL